MDLIVLDFIETEYFMSGMSIFMTDNFVEFINVNYLDLMGSRQFHIDYVLDLNLADVTVIKLSALAKPLSI